MNARLLPSLLLQLVAIALGWNFLVAALGQGAHYVTSGWWGSLLGLVILAMGLVVPVAGLAAGLVASLSFRLPATRASTDDEFADAVFSSTLMHTLGYLACGLLLWQLRPAQPGPHAAYGTGFAITSVLIAVAFALLASIAAVAIVARRGPRPA